MNNSEISIVVADDHPMLLKGLTDELTANGFKVVGAANGGLIAMELIKFHEPKIALLDIDMPVLNGFEVVKLSRDRGFKTRFIMISFHKEMDYVLQAKSLNISGYLLKEDSFFEIEKCIQTVAKGEQYFSSSFGNIILSAANEELSKLQLLTSSEKSILKQISKQLSTLEIADSFSISIRTVEKHRSNIIKKLALDKSTNTLTNWALIHRQSISEI